MQKPHSALSYLWGFYYHTSSESEGSAPSDSLLVAGPLSQMEVGGALGRGQKEVTAPTPGSVLSASQLVFAPRSHKQEATQKPVLWDKAALSLGLGFPEAWVREGKIRRVCEPQRSGKKLTPGEAKFPKQLAKLESSKQTAVGPVVFLSL